MNNSHVISLALHQLGNISKSNWDDDDAERIIAGHLGSYVPRWNVGM